MRTGFRRVAARLLPCLALTLACGDDGTRPGLPPPTLDAAWPNDDGREWSYDVVVRTWTDSTALAPYPTRESVPPIPALGELAARLAVPIPGTPDSVATGLYGMRFEGTRTTLSGARGQNLVESITGAAAAPSRAEPQERRFLQHLAAARPDLRAKIAARYPDLAPSTVTNLDPLYLHGAAYEKTPAYVGGYGDVDTLLAWKWLEADLTPGHEFTHQLVPSLADDVFLHARVVAWRNVVVPSGSYSRAVEVVYAVDYGISTIVSDDQQVIGYYRWWDYGSIVYAPDVGPVRVQERVLPFPYLADVIAPEQLERTLSHRGPPAAPRLR